MIKRFYVMELNGLLIYSKTFTKDSFDDNVLIGFFASVANFSREALQSVIKDIELGQDNKIVLFENKVEKLLAVAIVNSSDDNNLIIEVLRNIIHDFIILFSPDYDKISIPEVEDLIDNNIKRYTSLPLLHRIILSWIILVPISIIITILNIMATSYYFQYIFREDRLITQEELITEVIPEVVLISTIIILVIYVIPNLLQGYIILERNLAYLNSILYMLIILVAYFNSAEPLFFYVILYGLPWAVFTSIVFAHIGFRLGKRRKIVKLKS